VSCHIRPQSDFINSEEGLILWELVQHFHKSNLYNTISRSANFGNSFESSHGFMHIVVGGSGGHIAPVAYVGFDPILYALLNRQP